jgi:hypothetical protein
MKSYDVYLDSFVNVSLPDDVDADSNEGARKIYELATAKYLELLASKPPQFDLNWERYEEGDVE